MFDHIEFEAVAGDSSDKKVILFALTTCGFCKKARTFLEEHNINYSYLYMDKIDNEVKIKMKSEFAEKFNKRLTYPTLLIDDSEILSGFIRIAWEKELLD